MHAHKEHAEGMEMVAVKLWAAIVLLDKKDPFGDIGIKFHQPDSRMPQCV